MPLADMQFLASYRAEGEAAARDRLKDQAFQDAFQLGHEIPLEEAIAIALREETPARRTGAASKAASPLTSREQEIADLVARGLTNKDIAARLVISTRTAEGNIQHILTKLGFTARAQIAACATEQRTEQERG